MAKRNVKKAIAIVGEGIVDMHFPSVILKRCVSFF